MVVHQNRSLSRLWVILIDRGATYPVLISHAGPLSSKSCTVTGVDGKTHACYFTGPLTCQFEQFLISHAFLVVPECPTPLLGKTSGIHVIIRSHIMIRRPWAVPFLDSKTDQLEEQGAIHSHILYAVNPAVWDKGIPGKAINVQSVKINLKP